MAYFISSLRPEFAIVLQALLGGLKRRISAALLLYQEILRTALLLGGIQQFFPGCIALTEQDLVPAIRPLAPVLQVQRANPAGVCIDPRDRIVSHLHAGADIELK